MIRPLLAAVGMFLLTAGTASAQGFSGSRVIPGSMPQVPIPGTLPMARPAAPPLANGWWFGGGYPGAYNGGFYSPWFYSPGFYGNGFSYGYGSYPAPAPAPEPAPAKPQIVPGTAFAATLTIQLPVAGDVWVNGLKEPGTFDSFKVTTTAIARGAEETYTVRAVWVLDGKKYAAERKVPLGAGDRVKLTIASGDPVPEK